MHRCADDSSAQWAVSTRAFSKNLAWPHGTNAKPSIGANKHSSQHRGCETAAAGAAGTSLPIFSTSLSSRV